MAGRRVKKFKHPFSRKVKQTYGVFGIVILVLVLAVAKRAGLPVDFLFDNGTQRATTSQPANLSEGTYNVGRVVDGDTLVLAGTTKTYIRLIGADTPETVKPNTPVQPFGREASQFTRDAIAQNGNKIRICFDGDQTDRYGRTLAMVWLGETLLNEQLIREGLARAELQYRYSQEMKNRFQAAEDLAKHEKRGIWSLDANLSN
jgi:micrococcal nuclease